MLSKVENMLTKVRRSMYRVDIIGLIKMHTRVKKIPKRVNKTHY